MILAYSHYHQEGETELDYIEKEVTNHQQVCEIIDSYPWQRELELLDELDAAGFIDFFVGDDMNRPHVFYRLTTFEKDLVELTLEICLDKGFLGIFGRKVHHQDLGTVSIDEAKAALKNIFTQSAEYLYRKYTRTT